MLRNTNTMLHNRAHFRRIPASKFALNSSEIVVSMSAIFDYIPYISISKYSIYLDSICKVRLTTIRAPMVFAATKRLMGCDMVECVNSVRRARVRVWACMRRRAYYIIPNRVDTVTSDNTPYSNGPHKLRTGDPAVSNRRNFLKGCIGTYLISELIWMQLSIQ